MNKQKATAQLRGSLDYPEIYGTVDFEELRQGVLVTAKVFNLPSDPHENGVFAFHIHEGGSCNENGGEPFPSTGGHYNPDSKPHPYHAGDLPPLFGNHGYAYMSVFTDRFTIDEIIGRTVIIHGGTDDFNSQPAGNAGEKIACGRIIPN